MSPKFLLDSKQPIIQCPLASMLAHKSIRKSTFCAKKCSFTLKGPSITKAQKKKKIQPGDSLTTDYHDNVDNDDGAQMSSCGVMDIGGEIMMRMVMMKMTMKTMMEIMTLLMMIMNMMMMMMTHNF